MKVRTVYNLERNSFDIIDLDMENLPTPQQRGKPSDEDKTAMLIQPEEIERALITTLADDDKLTRDAIEDYVNVIASLYELPNGTNLEQIIENVANKLIEDKAV